jgi:hypothetical protein
MTVSPVAHDSHASFVSTPGAHAAEDAIENLILWMLTLPATWGSYQTATFYFSFSLDW